MEEEEGWGGGESGRVGCIPGKFGFFLEREVEHMLGIFFFGGGEKTWRGASAAVRRPRGRWFLTNFKGCSDIESKKTTCNCNIDARNCVRVCVLHAVNILMKNITPVRMNKENVPLTGS